MVLTKCKKAAALAQLDASPNSEVNICDSEHGLTIDFGDKEAQEKLERMMTPSARAAVRELLDRMEADRAEEEAALLQHDGPAFLQQVTGSNSATAPVAGEDTSDEDMDDDIDAQGSSSLK